MPTAISDPTTTPAEHYAAAANLRAQAIEAEIRALRAIRIDPAAEQRTEGVYRGLIARQDRYRRHAISMEKLAGVAQ